MLDPFPAPLPNIGGLALAAPQTDCGEEVDDVDESNEILSGTLASFDALAIPDCDLTGATPCPGQPSPARGALDGGVCPHELGNLAAQTLALTYNTLFFPDSGMPTFGNQLLAPLEDCIVKELIVNGLPLSDLGTPTIDLGSTFFEVLERANRIINDADIGGTTITRPMVETMTVLLGHCVNRV